MEVSYPLISDIAKGRCLPFVGAGFSKNAKLPTDHSMPDWPELAAILASHAKTPDGTTPLAVAQRYEEKFGRVQLIETIRDSLHLDKARPGRAHKSFVRLPFDTIYTTNFDLLLEEAYSEETRPFRSLVGELQLPFHAGQAASTIIKMHGDLRHAEHIVVTQDDYDTFLEKYPVIATHLSAMLITRTPLFLGYSLTDPDFGNIRKVVRSRLGAFERMAYIVQFDVSSEKAEEALRDHLHVISLETGTESSDDLLASFFQAVQDTLDTKEAVNLRSTRPDVFEEVKAEVIKKAVQSPDQSLVVEASSRLCFVLMPFGERFDALYRNVIALAVRDQGFTPLRADELTGTGFVMEQIRAAIQQARFCIADLTTANPNVLYEVGLAHAAAKPTIFLAEKASKLPFDLAHQRVIFYEGSAEAQRTADMLRDAISLLASQNRMPEATRMLDNGLYRASIAASGIALEERLVFMLRKARPGTLLRKTSLNRMLSTLMDLGQITETELSQLSEVVALRNRAVHGPDEPSKLEAEFVLNAVRTFLERNSSAHPRS